MCYYCKRFGHFARNCRKGLGLCLICGGKGHFVKDCPKKQDNRYDGGYGNRLRGNSVNISQNQRQENYSGNRRSYSAPRTNFAFKNRNDTSGYRFVNSNERDGKECNSKLGLEGLRDNRYNKGIGSGELGSGIEGTGGSRYWGQYGARRKEYSKGTLNLAQGNDVAADKEQLNW